MKLKLRIKDREYEVEIKKEEQNKFKIKIGQKEFLFREEEGEEKISFTRASLPKRDFLKKELLSPIAGIISEIFVKEGEFVKKDQKVLILSAMKMENEIVSEFSGKVKEILVKKDQEVKDGDVLIVLI